MTEKLLPPGRYTIRVMVVGGATIDGNVLVVHMHNHAAPEKFGNAARQVIGVLAPPRLERIAAGSWLMIGLDYEAHTAAGSVFADQVAIAADVAREEFIARLGADVPPVLEKLANAMCEAIGIEPITVDADAARRPALLN